MSAGAAGERICLAPRLSGVGGMVSFQHRLAAGLEARGVEVCYDLDGMPCAAVLVVGGTRNLAGLQRARRRGARIVQRLDGMNWLHRRLRTGARHFIRAEYGNWLLALVRSRLADGIVYQSEFSRGWWQRVYGPERAAHSVVYNGVDLGLFTPAWPEQPPEDRFRLLMVEGSLMGGYEMGLEVGVQLAQRVDAACRRSTGKGAELMVVGRVAPEVQQRWQSRAGVALAWAGLSPGERIPAIDRSAHLLYSADLNAACPNSVIEALACGLPVVAFDTGALPELVQGQAGRIAAYGGDPWRLDPPDIAALAQAAFDVLERQETYRTGARRRAEAAFGLERVVDGYLQALLGP